MMSRAYQPIIAAHEIRSTDHPSIRAGTSGEIIGISGDIPPHYCVTFWPSGRDREPPRSGFGVATGQGRDRLRAGR